MSRKFMSASAALFLGLALTAWPVPALAVSMPGSSEGFSGAITIGEDPEGGGEFAAFQFPGHPFITGFLLMCEPGTTCSPTDTSHQNWSDVVQWLNIPNTGVAKLFSDPEIPFQALSASTLALPEVLLPGGGDGVVYLADDGAGNITTWTIISDQPVVPEPSTLLLLGSGLAPGWLATPGDADGRSSPR